ncbi:MAG: hypothetical protein ABI315_10165 [Bacteroidia bacterium]
MIKVILIYFTTFLWVIKTDAQNAAQDSASLDYKKIYSFCLDANIPAALKIVSLDKSPISVKDSNFIENFKNRFAFSLDKSNYIQENSSKIDSLFKIFRRYWRSALLEPTAQFDTTFLTELNTFFREMNLKTENRLINKDSIDFYFKKYISNNNLHATDGVGKTGKLYDLLVWQTQKDTTYSFKVHKERITVKVIFMSNFITLGWEDYATIGRYYPSGWATDSALYCVTKSYDLTSEKFLISYLAHEGRHFKDYKVFPKLKSPDLEYRAKLTELSLARKTLYSLIEFFISNSNYHSESSHQIANYCVISNLSKKIFKKDFENDIEKWKRIDTAIINKTAYSVLKNNTIILKKNAANIQSYIK